MKKPYAAPVASLGAMAGAQPMPSTPLPGKPKRQHHGKNLGKYLHPPKKR